MIPWLGIEPGAPFPPVERALTRPDGLLAAGGDLSLERLVNAYGQGIFPWYSEGQPILWWSPDPRCVLFCAQMHVSRRLERRLRTSGWRFTLDRAFEQVVDACAAPRADDAGTWITPAMRAAYLDLHRHGLAHSLEAWRGNTLVGGIYGVALGRIFFGESMFHSEADASKACLVMLCRQLERWGFPLLDCQVHSPHLERMGAELIPRERFGDWLRHVGQAGPDGWALDTDLAGG